MRNIILFLWLSVIISSNSFCLTQDLGKRIIVVGEGVTGTWAAAKISENLAKNDELIIVSPPKKDIVKDMGHGVFQNDTTSAFLPIGIQIETGVINLEPPSQKDIEKALSSSQFSPDEKLYISHHLDNETKNKLDHYVNRDQSKDLSSIILRYHREICLPEWKKYIKENRMGAGIDGLYPLSPDVKILKEVKEKIIKNRIHAGYSGNAKTLKILGPEKLITVLPHYSQIIKAKNLSGLVGLDYDGRVKNQLVMETLNKKIKNGKTRLTKIHAWVESLKISKDDQGNNIVTGIRLQNNKTLNADVVILAMGHGIEKVLQNTNLNLNLPILNKWGVVYSLSRNQQVELQEQPTIMMRGLGIVRDMPHMPITFAVGEWILPKGKVPDPKNVVAFVKKSSLIWNTKPHSETGKIPIYVQPRPMTLDGLPVLDARTKGLIILNPSGSQGNTQAPGSAYFAASKTLEQLGRKVPPALKLLSTVDWKQFELYPGRFKKYQGLE